MAKSVEVEVHVPDLIQEDLDQLDDERLTVQAYTRMRSKAKSIEYDCRLMCEEIHAWCQMSPRYRKPHWMRLKPTWDAFCEVHLGFARTFIDAMLKGYEKLSSEGKPIPVSKAVEAAQAQADVLGEQGNPNKDMRNEKGEFTKGCDTTFGLGDEEPDLFTPPPPEPEKPKRRNRGDKAYLLRRIARDAPAVLEAYGRGEYPSVAAAARDAGMSHLVSRKRVSLPADIDTLADMIRERYSSGDIDKLAVLLQERSSA